MGGQRPSDRVRPGSAPRSAGGAAFTLEPVTTNPDDEQTIQQVIEKLAVKHPDTSRQALEAMVREEFNELSGRPVRDYLFILTERATKKRLKKSARPES
jgi:hypothetical protein